MENAAKAFQQLGSLLDQEKKEATCQPSERPELRAEEEPELEQRASGLPLQRKLFTRARPVPSPDAKRGQQP